MDMDLSWFHPEALRPAKRQRIQDDTDDTIIDRRPFILTPTKTKQPAEESTISTDGMVSSTTLFTHSPSAWKNAHISTDAKSHVATDDDNMDMDLSWFRPEALRPAKQPLIQNNENDSIVDRRKFALTPTRLRQPLHDSATSSTEGMISSTTYSTHSPTAVFSPKLGRKSSVSSDASSTANIENDDDDITGDKEIDHLRYLSQQRLRSAWDSIFERYGRDMGDEADEIDLSTQKIVIDRGHLKSVPKQCRIGSLAKMGLQGDLFDAIDTATQEDDDSDADADISSSDEQVEMKIRITPSKTLGQGAATKALQEAWTEYEMEMPTVEELLMDEYQEKDEDQEEDMEVNQELDQEDEYDNDEQEDYEDQEEEIGEEEAQIEEEQTEPDEEEPEVDEEEAEVEEEPGIAEEAYIEQEEVEQEPVVMPVVEDERQPKVVPKYRGRCACGKIFCFGCTAKSL